jgi:hypothetical protein
VLALASAGCFRPVTTCCVLGSVGFPWGEARVRYLDESPLSTGAARRIAATLRGRFIAPSPFQSGRMDE